MKIKPLVILLILMFIARAGYGLNIPQSQGRFTDTTATMEEIRQEIENCSAALEDANSCELAVLVIDTLQGATIEEYAEQVFNTWGIGKAAQANGILLLLATGDRQARIEVGYGLEHLITDARAGRFLTDFAIPHFRLDNWASGLRATAFAVADYLKANYTAATADEPVTRGLNTTTENMTPAETVYAPYGFGNSLLAFVFGLRLNWLLPLLFIVVNIILMVMKKFIVPALLGVQIGVTLLLFLFPLLLGQVAYLRSAFLPVAIMIIIYIAMFRSSRRHECPKCQNYMVIKSQVTKHPSYTSTGTRRHNFHCPACGYKNTTYTTIPRLSRSSSSGSSYRSSSSSSSYSSSSSSSSSSRSFGGGSSGGGGASVRF